MKKRISILIAAVLFLCAFVAQSSAFVPIAKNAMAQSGALDLTSDVGVETEVREVAEKKVYNKAVLEDDFTDDRIIVVLNRETTRRFKNYTSNDFSEIGLSQVHDLTSATAQWTEEQLTGKSTLKESMQLDSEVKLADDKLIANDDMLVDTTAFRRILSLELKEKSKENVLKAIKLLEKRDDILSAEPNYVFEPPSRYSNDQVFTNPSDPRWSAWGHWAVEKIQAPKAWVSETGSANIVVGIVDTGIDFTHPDLQNRRDQRLNVHRHFLAANAPFGTVETPFDVWINTPSQPSANGHGTQTAGIIGAQGDNALGIAGICWDVRLVSLRTYDTLGGHYDAMVRAINYAASISIPIIDLAHQNTSATSAQRTALQNAINAYGGLAVASAGNYNLDLDDPNTPTYPASMTGANLITVGALNHDDTRRPTSNYGKNSVDIFAYGERALTTAPGKGYTYFSGTSSSAPMVVGVAALIKSMKYDLTPEQIKTAIMDGVDKVQALDDLCVSGGRLNAYNSLLLAETYNVVGNPWQQRFWNSASNSHGTIKSSNQIYSNEQAYGAFDGWVGDKGAGNANGFSAGQWGAVGTSGWLELRLNNYINVSKIEFYNRQSDNGWRTKDAFFSGTGGVPLGSPFVAVNSDMGKTTISVANVITNVIRLNVLTSYNSKYIGANEIIITATVASPPSPAHWEQPAWTSNSNSHGTITANGIYSAEQAYGAFDGWIGDAATARESGYPASQWGVSGKSGWVQLKLNYNIKIHQIIFYNRQSDSGWRTKTAFFTGTNSIPLGPYTANSPFTAVNSNMGRTVVDVGGVVTDTVRLNITSRYSDKYVGANEIVIIATVV